jgi:hypothetical protein
MKPEIFWVIGDGTDVEKTTIAAALVRLLNKQGRRTIPFKPYALTRFSGAVDFLIRECPPEKARLFGGDSLELAVSSPHTTAEMADLIAPCNAFSFPTWSFKFLIRAGSSRTGNVRYFTSARARELLVREDFQKLMERIHLPLDKAEIIGEAAMANAPGLFPEAKSVAFDHIRQMGPDAIVFEGAGELLPIWHGCPTVNHVITLRGGRISFCLNLNTNFQPKNQFRMPLSLITPHIHASWGDGTSVNHLLVEKALVSGTSEALLEELLRKARYLS